MLTCFCQILTTHVPIVCLFVCFFVLTDGFMSRLRLQHQAKGSNKGFSYVQKQFTVFQLSDVVREDKREGSES